MAVTQDKVRFLLLNQFYAPDPAPTGQYLHDLAAALVKRGHKVCVICSRKSYNGAASYPSREIREGVEVVRLPASGFGRRGFAGKLSDYATFYGLLFLTLMSKRGKADVILSLTTPPYIGLLGKWAAWWHRGRHAHWIMDLYPDVMFAHGMTRKGRLLFRTLHKLTEHELRGAQLALSLGPAMAGMVSRYRTGGRPPDTEPAANPASSIDWMPLWSNSDMSPWPDDQPNPLRSARGWRIDDPVFLYSGNMGLGHRFGEFLQAAKHLGASGPRWVFAGGGKRRAEVESFASANPEARIEFFDYAPHEQLRAHLCAADVHLASLDPAWQGLMVPSKLQGSFAVGRPVLYVGGRNCETAAWIEESGGGWVVAENDLAGLLSAIKQASNPGEWRARGAAARRFAESHFDKNVNCRKIAELLEAGHRQ